LGVSNVCLEYFEFIEVVLHASPGQTIVCDCGIKDRRVYVFQEDDLDLFPCSAGAGAFDTL
jgi:hypothetical protein